MTHERHRRATIGALSLGLFALNAWICREIFSAEFLHNLSSNEAAFAAIARFFREHPTSYQWFPWFNGGMPIEFAYQPLLPLLSALTGSLTGWSDVRALHFVVATAYCVAPVTLFLFAWDYSESLAMSLTAALALSVASPAAMLVGVLRIQVGPWGDLRLYNIIHYGEGSHNLGAALLPLALLFLRRGILRRGPRTVIGAAVFCGLVVLASPFGAIDLVLGSVAIILAEGHGVRTVLLTGLASWCWISPWLPPSLIVTMRRGAWSEFGAFEANTRTGIAAAVAVAALALVWFGSRSLRYSFHRFVSLFAVWMCAIPLGGLWLGWFLVPMASRYQIELEMLMCLLFGIAAAFIVSRAGPRLRVAVLAVLVLAAARQANVYRHYVRGLDDKVNIQQTVEYQVTEWIDRNLPGQRTMVAGDTEYLFNLFSNNPQLSAGAVTTATNVVQQMAVKAIYDGRNSILWLKVFGNQAVYVPGAASADAYHSYADPRMFEGILPVLWRGADDTIYAVPQHSPALAHVIPRAAVALRMPRDGLDIEPVRAYAAALDDPKLPAADLAWIDPAHGIIHARMDRAQLLSIQINYDRGWRARVHDHVKPTEVRGREVPVGSDKLGLLVVEPGCDGDCEVDLSFGATAEASICRILSAAATLFGMVLLVLPGAHWPKKRAKLI